MAIIIRCTLALGLAFVLLQFVQVRRLSMARTAPKQPVPVQSAGDPEVSAILGRSCIDCHSSHTVVPWYGRVAPISWILSSHVNRGRQKLDFSAWDSRRPLRGEKQDICDAVSDGSMPLRSYILIHRYAKLTNHDTDAICNWANAQSVSQVAPAR